MTESIEFYFDFLSPYSYLAYRLARSHYNLKLKLKPVSLPQLIKLSGNIPPASLKPRAAYLIKDLTRSMKLYGLDNDSFKIPEQFPFDTRSEMYQLIKMIEIEKKSEKEINEFVMKTWKRIFHKGQYGDESPPIKFEETEREQLKSLLLRNTREALNLDAYGVPFWRIENSYGEEETFFGSDRFHHIIDFLKRNPQSKL